MSSRELLVWQCYLAASIAGLESRSPDADPRRTRGLAVYRDAYVLRLREVLTVDYPLLRNHVGRLAFDELCIDYVRAHPSDHYSVRWFGRRLPAHLAERAPWSTQPELAELARFEWSLGEAFDAADAPSAAVAELARVDPAAWPDLGLAFHPSVRLLSTLTDIVERSRARPGGGYPGCADAEAPVPRQHWVIWRKDFTVRFRKLVAGEHVALTAALAARTMAATCLALEAEGVLQDVAGGLASFVAGWLSDGLVSRCVVSA